jgi:hypothetical protein
MWPAAALGLSLGRGAASAGSERTSTHNPTNDAAFRLKATSFVVGTASSSEPSSIARAGQAKTLVRGPFVGYSQSVLEEAAMKRLLMVVGALVIGLSFSLPAIAKDKVKSKFYDFSEMLIDGEIKKPTALYTDARSKVNFDRLLKLKKSFIEALKSTGRNEVFK